MHKLLLLTVVLASCAPVTLDTQPIVKEEVNYSTILAQDSDIKDEIIRLADLDDKKGEYTLPPEDAVMVEVEEFDDPAIDAVIAAMDEIKKEEKKLWIRIDSFGGSVEGGYKLIQAIEAFGSPVTCVVDSKGMSMGFFTLESCDVRLMTKRATLMAHEPAFSGVGGNRHKLDEYGKRLQVLMEGFIATCVEKMKISEEEFKARTENKNWYFGYKEAMEVGAIDGLAHPKHLPELKKVEVKRESFLFFMKNGIKK